MFRIVFLVGAFFVLAPGAALAGNLGTNLGGVNYYDGQVVFSDIVRQGGDWLENVPVDQRGWPLRFPARMAIAELQYPRGTYSVRWQGQGTFTVGGKTFSGRDGQGQVFLDGSSLVLLEMISSGNNRLRNIRVLVPGYRPGQIFRPRYLASLQPYRALRFMDWQRTNGTFADPAPLLRCRDALRAGYVSQGRRIGVSVLWMVRLANRLRAAPWFTVPHKADRSWVQCHARYVRKHLQRGLLPRYEFSNETWNPAFEQYHDLQAASGGGFEGIQRETALRHNEMVRQINQAMKGRPWRSVLSGQAANSWVLEQRLLVAKTDDIAIAPYMHLPGNLYDPEEAALWAERSETEVFQALQNSLEEEVRPWIKDHLRFKKPLLAYEGGQHLAGFAENNDLTDLLVRSNRSLAMGELYRSYLEIWREETGDRLFMHFLDSGPYTKYGSWGALESPDQLSSPKYDALQDFVSN